MDEMGPMVVFAREGYPASSSRSPPGKASSSLKPGLERLELSEAPVEARVGGHSRRSEPVRPRVSAPFPAGQ